MARGQGGFGVSLVLSTQEQAGESVGGKRTGAEVSLGLCPCGFRPLPGDFSAFTLSLSLQEQTFPDEIKRKTGIFAVSSQGLIKTHGKIPAHWRGEVLPPPRHRVTGGN